MTPNEIEVLIHCHVCQAQHPRADALEVRDALESFFRNGLITKEKDGVYHTTDRGAAHISQLCNTPWPRQIWVDEMGRIIDA